MIFELLALVAGTGFGYLRSGKEDLVRLMKQGVFLGVVLGVVLGLLSIVTARGAQVGAPAESVADIVVRVVIIALLFITGVMIGDFLETRKKR